MQLVSAAVRWLRRTDTRAAVSISALLLLGIAAQSASLYTFVNMEAMEAADQRLAFALEVTARRIADGGDASSAVTDLLASSPDESFSARLLDATNGLERAWARWPDAERTIPTTQGDDARDLSAFRLLRADNFLVGATDLAGGRRLELALSLDQSVAETREIGQGLLIVSLGSGALALLVASIATRRAFRPLRNATTLLQRIDAQHLSERLPLLGTGDPVDRHAETLNKILEKVEAAFSRLRAFSGDVAHELRTPLNRIGHVTDVALLGGDPQELRSGLETIQRTSSEMTEIVQSLLLIAEIDDGRRPAQHETFDAEAWIARSVSAYAPLFEEQGTQISLAVEPVTITGDRSLLDRVLVNLLDNALHHAAVGGRVELHCRKSDDGVTISVEDSGPGIRTEERERVFERFVRLDESASAPGHGLGLALASAIVRMHGGGLSVESSALGGARFVWRLAGATATELPEQTRPRSKAMA